MIMHEPDRLAIQQLLLASKFAIYASEQLRRLIISTAKTANGIGARTSRQLAELEQHGQLTDPIKRLILDQTQLELAALNTVTATACDAIVQVVSRYPSA